MDDTPRHTVIVEGQFNDDNLTHQSYRKIGRRKRWNNRGLYKSFILIFNIQWPPKLSDQTGYFFYSYLYSQNCVS